MAKHLREEIDCKRIATWFEGFSIWYAILLISILTCSSVWMNWRPSWLTSISKALTSTRYMTDSYNTCKKKKEKKNWRMNRLKEYTNDLTGQRARKHARKPRSCLAEDSCLKIYIMLSLRLLLRLYFRAIWPTAMQNTQAYKEGLATPNCYSHNSHFLPCKSEKKCSWITKLLAWKEDT